MSKMPKCKHINIYETSPEARRLINQAVDDIMVLIGKAMAERDAKRALLGNSSATKKDKSSRS